MEQYFSSSASDTFLVGHQLGKKLKSRAVLCFFGDLGAGKTTLIKGLISSVAQIEPRIVQSPTFTYLNIYEGIQTVYHFDLYRLRDGDEFLSMGFDDYLETEGICCIEWSERIIEFLPSHYLSVYLTYEGQNKRKIIINNQNNI